MHTPSVQEGLSPVDNPYGSLWTNQAVHKWHFHPHPMLR